MVKVQKGKVIKEISKNILDDYLRLGWVIVNDKKTFAPANAENSTNDKL